MKKLRLLLFEECNRSCVGCCNKDWDLKSLPTCKLEDLGKYDEVLITGGEPMLQPELVINTAFAVPTSSDVFLYTAKVDDIEAALEVSHFVSGITLTLHEQRDVEPFVGFSWALFSKHPNYKLLSLRLNVFKGVDLSPGLSVIPASILNRWIIKPNIEWVKNCPLPNDEVFMRLQ